MHDLEKTVYINRRLFYGAEFASAPFIKGVEQELVHLVQAGVIEVKKTPDASLLKPPASMMQESEQLGIL